MDGGSIGKVVTQPNATYHIGATVTAKFLTGDPRNNFRNEGTFLTIELQTGSTWKVIANDGNWETRYRWKRHPPPRIDESWATIEWDIPAGTALGTYRIGHFGDAKPLGRKPKPFSSYTNSFKVIA